MTDNNNNNNNNNEIGRLNENDLHHSSYLLFGNRLPNAIILKIVGEIEDDIDLICLLLTCKAYYYSFREHYCITRNFVKFKGIKYVTDQCDNSHGNLFHNTYFSSPSFKLKSFSNIFYNSISTSSIRTNTILYGRLNAKVEENIKNFVKVDGDNHIDTIAVITTNVSDVKETDVDLLRDLPVSTKTLYINRQGSPSDTMQIDEHNIPPLLETLVVGGNGAFNIGNLPNTLQKLTFLGDLSGSNIKINQVFPRSLHTLILSDRRDMENVNLENYNIAKSWIQKLIVYGFVENTTPIVPMPTVQPIFPPTLTHLELCYNSIPPPGLLFPPSMVYLKLSCFTEEQFTLDIAHLMALHTFELISPVEQLETNNLRLPPNLFKLILDINIDINTPSQLPPNLHTLDTRLPNLDRYEKGVLPSTLTDLTLSLCSMVIPPGLIPESVEHLSLQFYQGSCGEFVQGSLPKSLKSISITGDECKYACPLPDSLTNLTYSYLPSSTTFPPTLRSLSISFPSKPPSLTKRSLLNLPTTLTSFEVYLDPIPNGLEDKSIEFYRFTWPFDNRKGSTPGGVGIMPDNIKRVKITIPHTFRPFTMRIDTILFLSKVEELVINCSISNFTFIFQIRRFSDDGKSILVVDKDSLLGGFLNVNPSEPAYLNGSLTTSGFTYLYFSSSMITKEMIRINANKYIP